MPRIGAEYRRKNHRRHSATTTTITTTCNVLVLVLVIIIAVVHEYDAGIGVCHNIQRQQRSNANRACRWYYRILWPYNTIDTPLIHTTIQRDGQTRANYIRAPTHVLHGKGFLICFHFLLRI